MIGQVTRGGAGTGTATGRALTGKKGRKESKLIRINYLYTSLHSLKLCSEFLNVPVILRRKKCDDFV